MIRRVLPSFAGLALLAAAVAASAQPGPDTDAMFRATTLSISAHGEVRAAPDKAFVTLGVQTTLPTAAEAMADNARRMGAVIAALRRQGLEGKDIQTSGVNLAAQYDYQPNKAPRLVGYQASNQVTVTVSNLARLGPALDAATAAGGNQVQGVSFGLKDPGAAENQARLKAVQALEAKAKLYATAEGYHVARLIQLSEGGGVRPVPMVSARLMSVRAAPATPIEPGELTVRVDVSGLYELTK